MPVQIGQKPDHGFDAPMGLLGDCHRRIEKFLNVMLAVARRGRGGPLDERDREALEKSIRYFENAAPHHNEDEEKSLFPRLRRLDDPKVKQVLAKIDRLEADHQSNDRLHEQANDLARQWIGQGTLDASDAQRLVTLLERLEAVYQQHIALEDDEVFPLARQVLGSHHMKAMGREMAERRGLDPKMPPRRCRHGKRNQEGEGA